MASRYSFLTVGNGKMLRTAALDLFYTQYKNVPIYRQYVDLLRVSTRNVNVIEQIPFLPIQFFRTHDVCRSMGGEPEMVFTSSGTTGAETSRHICHG